MEFMFTGLIETMGTVAELRAEPPGIRLTIAAPMVAEGTKVGDSVAINGCCLTVVAIEGERLAFQAGAETLQRTNLGALRAGSAVNLERSLMLGDRLGGHLVTGHIDGKGRLAERRDERDWSTCRFQGPGNLMRQIAPKGSIAADGVSLTVVAVAAEQF